MRTRNELWAGDLLNSARTSRFLFWSRSGSKIKFGREKKTDEGFSRLMREFTVTGFYTSEIGFKELDNPALKFYAESPECPHKEDREHKHLGRAGS